jgi:hypothetical protein
LEEQLDLTEMIFSANGQLVSTNYIGKNVAGTYVRQLNANDLAAGMYTFVLQTDKGIISTQFVVQ